MVYDVFISYRRGKGSDLASALESHLERRGFSVYLDVDTKYTGDFMDYVGDAIKHSSLFLLLITDGSLERMVDPKDISRREIETALDNNIEILPISTIGDKAFQVMNEYEGLPDSIRSLRNFNCRLYKHELRDDTFGYIVEVVDNIRKERFDSITKSALKSITQSKDEQLSSYMRTAKDEEMSFQGKRLRYTGNLKFDKVMGQGTLIDLSSGLVYVAEWNPYGNFSGKGQVFRNGELIYEGEFDELEFTGQGRLVEGNEVLEGTFSRGKLHGKGSKISPNGTTYTGIWSGGQLYSNSYIRYPDGSEYSGRTSELTPHGHGIMIKPDGRKYDGFFNRGSFQEGAYYKGNTIFIGTFDNWNPHGKGVMYNKSFSKLFEGKYDNGIPLGVGKLYTKGSIFSSSFIPRVVYDKIIEFVPNFDAMNVVLETTFNNDKIVDYSDFEIYNAESSQSICKGRIKKVALGTFSYKVFSNYEEVFSEEIY